MRKSWVLLMVAVLIWLIPAACHIGLEQAQLLQLAPGQLTVGSIGPGNLQAVVDETIYGIYQSAVWYDTPDSRAGWQGLMAISHAIYTCVQLPHLMHCIDNNFYQSKDALIRWN